MAAGATPLSLAYLIEISFVLNLAYHELNTFRLRRVIREKASESQRNFRDMRAIGDEGSSFIKEFFGELDQLESFHTGECTVAWNAKWKRWFYRHLIYCGRDRCVIRTLLFFDVLVLLICTAFSGSQLAAPFSLNNFSSVLWLTGYCSLFISILVPACFMYWTRCCTRYALGSVEEDPEEITNAGGRLYELEQIVLQKSRTYMSSKL